MTLKAVPSPRPENDALDDAFFDQSSIAPIEIDGYEAAGIRDWEDEEPAPLANGTRRAMQVTLGMLGTSITGLGIFLFYTRVLMPTPVELGAASAELPILPPSAADVVEYVAPHAPVQAAAALVAPAPAFELGDTAAAAAVRAIQPAQHAATTGPVARTHDDSNNSGNDDARVKQAYRSLNNGDAQRAIAQARRVVNASPERADAWLVLGSAYDMLHDRSSALLAFRACAMHGQGPTARTCEQLARQ